MGLRAALVPARDLPLHATNISTHRSTSLQEIGYRTDERTNAPAHQHAGSVLRFDRAQRSEQSAQLRRIINNPGPALDRDDSDLSFEGSFRKESLSDKTRTQFESSPCYKRRASFESFELIDASLNKRSKRHTIPHKIDSLK